MMSKAAEFLYLQQEEVIECGGLDMDAYLAGAEKAFTLLEQGDCIERESPLIQWPDGSGRRIAFHPAYVGGDVNVAGIKWIPSNPENPARLGLPRSNALTILTEPVSGYPLAVMDGKLISDMRTGAVAGVGAKYLARDGAEVVTLLGAGPIARTQLWAVARAMPHITRIVVYDLVPAHARRFIEDMSDRLGLDKGLFSVAESAEAAVREGDVVATSTNVSMAERYLAYDWLKPGALIVNTSVNDPTFETVEKADLIVVDIKDQLDVHRGKLVLAAVVASGLAHRDDIVELGRIITGLHPGRTDDAQKILFSPIGLGLHDLINAKRVYDVARQKGVGTTLKLWDEPVWF
jgi:ornithine cyclodeaminase/alanine dehydrogenase-like protein (mu-crystallin family)